MLLREGLADPISHDQTVRLETNIRTAFIRADKEDKAKEEGGEEQGKLRTSNRNKRQTPRYIPLTTKNKLYKNVAEKIIGKSAEKRKPGRPKKKKSYKPNEEALKELELKRECKGLAARFGVGNVQPVLNHQFL